LDIKVWTGLIWPKTVDQWRAGSCEHGTEPSGSIKAGNCWQTKRLLTSQKGNRSMKLVQFEHLQERTLLSLLSYIATLLVSILIVLGNNYFFNDGTFY
jgi:hypothetical protein